jgi:hypothetical protein
MRTVLFLVLRKMHSVGATSAHDGRAGPIAERPDV